MNDTSISEVVAEVGLVDHHCHGLTTEPLDRAAFELLATESDWPSSTGATIFDSPVGLGIRALCAPLLDLPKHVDGETYWSRRTELGDEEVARRLMPATGIERYIVDTGFQSSAVQSPEELGGVTDRPAHEIVRLEAVAESIAQDATANSYADTVAAAIESAAQAAVGLKSIIAYRFGLDFDPVRPTDHEVRVAADEWLSGSGTGASPRMDHPVLLRHLLWQGVDTGLPIQFHVGYGDSDINLHRCDPTKMTEFIRATRTSGTRIMLLHCYPFVREAGFLAQVYPHVYLDTGASTHYTGWSSHNLIRESLELAPFDKVLFSSDAFGLPELYVGGASLWRRGITRLFGEWLEHDEISLADATRYVGWIAKENARRVYGWGDPR